MKQFRISSDGAMVHTQSPLLEGWEKCEDLKTLLGFVSQKADMPTADMNWRGTKLPAQLMQQILGTIRHFPHMEVAFSLYYSLAEGKWAVKCPRQNGSGASVHFEDDGDGMPDGYAIIGSIHTHPEMGAFWSGTDMGDQKKKHGVHLVLGLRQGYATQYKLSIFTPNGFYDKNWTDIFEEVDFTQNWEPVEAWIEEIKAQRLPRPTYSVATSVGSSYTPAANPYYRTTTWRNDRYYGGWHGGWTHADDATPSLDGGSSSFLPDDPDIGAPTLSIKEQAEKTDLLRKTINELRRAGAYSALTRTLMDCLLIPVPSIGADVKDQKRFGEPMARLVMAYSDDLLERLEDVLWSVNELAEYDPQLDRGVMQVLEDYGWVADDEDVSYSSSPVEERQEAVTC